MLTNLSDLYFVSSVAFLLPLGFDQILLSHDPPGLVDADGFVCLETLWLTSKSDHVMSYSRSGQSPRINPTLSKFGLKILVFSG